MEMENDVEEDQSEFILPSKDMCVLEEQKKKVLRQRAKFVRNTMGYDSSSDAELGKEEHSYCGEVVQSGRSETSIISNGSAYSRKSVSRRTPNVVATDHRTGSGRSLNLSNSEIRKIRGGADGDKCRQSPSFNALQKKFQHTNDLQRPSSSHEFHRGDAVNYNEKERPSTAMSLNRHYESSSPECTPRTTTGPTSPRCVCSFTSIDTVIPEEDEPEDINSNPTQENGTGSDEPECDIMVIRMTKDRSDDSGADTDSTVAENIRAKSSLSKSSSESEYTEVSEQQSASVIEEAFSQKTPSAKNSFVKSEDSKEGVPVCPQPPPNRIKSGAKAKLQYPSPADYGVYTGVPESTISRQSYGTNINKSHDTQKVDKSTYEAILKMFIIDESLNYEEYYNASTSLMQKVLDEKDGLTYKFYNMQKNGDDVTYSLAPNQIIDNLEMFVMHPVPPGYIIKCRITRNRRGLEKNMFPVYYMHLERDDGRKNLLMVARKRKKSATSNYTITTDPTDMSKESEAVVGSCRSNLLGTNFSMYDGLMSYKHFKFHERIFTNSAILYQYREELGVVLYETNILGFKGPRKMDVVIPKMISVSARMEMRPDKRKDTLMEKMKRNEMDHLQKLKNKTPVWNVDNQSFVLNFHGRVTHASVKNFQLVNKDTDGYCGLQFGRVAEDIFHLDFGYPMCPLQAFSIVLSSFDSKLACE